MSEARNYRRAMSKKTEKVVDVTLPSGRVWKMREPNLQQFLVAGKLPGALVAKMAAMSQDIGDDAEEAGKRLVESMSPDDVMSSLAFGRDLLLHCAIEPRISLSPSNDDELAPEEIDPADFQFLMTWLMSGGKSGESLKTFR